MTEENSIERIIEMIEMQPLTIKIQRFSHTTYIGDCNKEAKRIYASNGNKPSIWRCKIGEKGKWHTAKTIYDAIKLALDGQKLS